MFGDEYTSEPDISRLDVLTDIEKHQQRGQIKPKPASHEEYVRASRNFQQIRSSPESSNIFHDCKVLCSF